MFTCSQKMSVVASRLTLTTKLGQTLKLNSTRQITWNIESHVQGIKGLEVHFGQGAQPIQVAVAQSDLGVTRAQLKTLFTERKGRLNTLIIVVIHGDQASFFGPDADTEVMKQKISTAEAILNSILDQPNEVLAYQRATSIWRSKQTTDLVGFTNNGLFASHYIRSSVNHHPEWKSAQEVSQRIQNLRDQELIAGLGFEITSRPSNTFVLSAKGQAHRAVAILLDQSESFESKSTRLQASPVEWSLAIAAEQGAPWVIAIKDSQLRLYPAKDGVGVGQKSQAETYFEIDLLTIDEDKTGLLHLIFSAEALAEGGTADELLANSRKFASELGVRLRERVYESVVPMLATEVADQLRSKGHELDSRGLQLSYELTLRILFRLLFQAYAEDRGLLPAGRNENFDKNSIKYWAQYLLDRDVEAPYGEASTIWFDLVQIWDAIDQGNPDMQIPAYNGGLFGSNPDLHPEGALIRTLSIPDRVLGPALRALVIDDNTEDGVAGAVDFRSLSVREFGTIYEGLLESSLSVADQDLTVDSKGAWVPAKPGDEVFAQANEVYFHSASGERKATGSYYTPSFIVDHLIERSVEPALNDHLARVKELLDAEDQAAAYKKFFDFRVADLAMGSAHFLVAAIDKIETVMRSFLLKPGNEIDGVSAELVRLEAAAKEALGKDEAAYAEIERASLLRRQIARRCVYGLDINPMAVELSRLAIWIHTFVPGLPMSSLEHNLVCGNSLTGIATVDEGIVIINPERASGATTWADDLVDSSLDSAKTVLENLSFADEADKAQAKDAASVLKLARARSYSARMIFDLAVAGRLDVVPIREALDEQTLIEFYSRDTVRQLVENLNPAHLPYLFPEVMLRDNPGFDVVIGNPPFKEVVVQELDFWNIRFKGLKGLDNAEQTSQIEKYREAYPALVAELEAQKLQVETLRKALGAGPFPGMGVGDPDLYKAFAWRFMKLVRTGGAMGLVLPNSIWTTKGSAEWRRQFFSKFSSDLVLISNNAEWAFENVNVGYRFTFIGALRSDGGESITVRGNFRSKEQFLYGRNADSQPIDSNLILSADEFAPLPSFESHEEVLLWQKLLQFQPLSDGRLAASRPDFQCAPATEIHVSLDGKTGVFTSNSKDHPIYNHLNVGLFSFDASAGPFDYGVFESYVIQQESKAHALLKRADSALRLWGRQRLENLGHPIRNARIAFRDVVHASNSRKAWFCLVPRNVLLTNKAPYLIFANEDPEMQAYVLGVLNSGPVDWFATLKVGLNLNFFILYTLPVPLFTGSERQLKIAQLSAGLATSAEGDFGDWGRISEPIRSKAERQDAMSLIDALVSQELELEESELRLIFGAGNSNRSTLEDVLKNWEPEK
jgi:hypothetical protein